MSIENQSLNQSAQNSQIIRQTKINSGAVNNELLKNIEILDSENSQLKAALAELQEDIKDKEESIDKSHKIITELRNEYSNLIKEYQNLEQINNDLISEIEITKKAAEGSKKANDLISKLQKQNADLINESNILKKENASMKSKLISNKNSSNKKEQDLKDKELVITDLKEKADNWVNMIKDREQLINEQSKKIRELNELIQRKDEQLKVMVNFSKEINKENKTNVAELTKQAVKTIKVFYNTLNNNSRNNLDGGYRVEFKNTDTTFKDFETIMKNKRANFLLEDAIQGMMYIPTDLKSVSKEFLMDMNLKTELIKSELYSGIIRELNIVKFLEDIFSKLNIKDSENIKYISQKVIELTTKFNIMMKENDKLKNMNKLLIQDKNNNFLFLKKFKDDVKDAMNKLRDKYSYLTNNIDNKVQNIKNSNIILKEKSKKDGDKLKIEMLALKRENSKLKNDIEELQKLLDTQKDNEKLFRQLEEEKDYLKDKNNSKSWNTIVKIVPDISFNYIQSKNSQKINTNFKYSDNIDINNDDETLNKKNNIEDDNIYKKKGNKHGNKNYQKKKKEIKNLKDEIGRVKDEINNLMLNSNNPDYNISDNFLSNKEELNTINNQNFKTYELKSDDNYDNLYKKIENLQNILKTEKNKNSNLEGEITTLKQYIDNNIPSSQNTIPNNTFHPKFFVKIFYTINSKIFSSSEIKKYYKIYNSPNINAVLEIFNKTCECLKRQIYESHFELDTANTDIDDNYINPRNVVIDNSYRLVNERILKLKKLEFDFINLSEFVKNYLVSQEIIVKIIFGNNNNVIQFEPIEKLFKLFEDCLNFKIDEMNDNIIFIRKLLIKMLKTQKNCLGLSLESLIQQQG
jgi:hypothetical protein